MQAIENQARGSAALKYVFTRILCGTALLLVLCCSISAVDQRNATVSPHGPLGIPCENCHTAAGWSPLRDHLEFSHDKTHFPLRGGHEKVACTQCHANPVFTDVGKNCSDCHADIHLRKFGADCAQCHVVAGWFTTKQQVRNHNNLFPLLGAHAAVECEACHKAVVGGQYRVLPYCSACHLTEFKKATNPNHVAQGFSQTCDMCHSQDSWFGAVSPQSRIPVLGHGVVVGGRR